MNVRQGPDTVFDRPPADILPALAGAAATGENGRVGTELVFWGYRQPDGQRVFFFACAQRPGFDCAARVPAICPTSTTVLANGAQKPPAELVREFLGRDFNSKAFFEDLKK